MKPSLSRHHRRIFFHGRSFRHRAGFRDDIFLPVLALVAGFGLWLDGDVDFGLLVGSIPGVVIGSLLSSHAPDHLLRPALAGVLLISGVKLLTT